MLATSVPRCNGSRRSTDPTASSAALVPTGLTDARGGSIQMIARARFRRGQIAVILTLAVPALIGAIAFGTDIAVLYMNLRQLQRSTDAAVMAGAAYLPSDPVMAVTTARSYARVCGIRNDEIVATQIG